MAVRGGLGVIGPREDSATKEESREAATAMGMVSGVEGDNVNGDCFCVKEQAGVPVGWTIHSKGGDDEDPISLVDKASQEHEVEHEKTGNNKDANHPPKWAPEKTAVKASPLMIEIPDDDDSESSIVVLMRYMCTPLNRSDSYDESDSLFSDDIYGVSKSEEDIKPSWTMTNNKVGVEILIQDVIMASRCSPALSPGGSLARWVETEKTSDVKGAASAEEKNFKKDNLIVDTTEESKKISKEKGTVVGSPKLVINCTSHSAEEEVTTPEACMASTSKTPAPNSLTPVCLIPRTPAGQTALRKCEEEFLSHVSAGKRIRKPTLTIDTGGETPKSGKREGTVLESPGYVHFPTVGCPPDKEEFKKHHMCGSTPKSPAPKLLTPVYLVPRTPAGQAALRKYEEEFMSLMSAEY
jgi:hypothetical protein